MADAASSPVQFSSGEKEVIERKLDVATGDVHTKKDINDFYEISRCVNVIKSGDFQKIALQFPDSLLVDSVAVASLIKKDTGRKVFILGDTSYGSCCVDEVAAQHVEADLIIHYGRACLSQTRRLPVLYIFGKWPVNTQSCVEQFRQMFPDPAVKIVIFFDVRYSHCTGEMESYIQGKYPNVIFTKLIYCTFQNDGKDNSPKEITGHETHSMITSMKVDVEMHSLENSEKDSSQISEKGYFCKFGREFRLPENSQLEDYCVFYIGGESLCLTNLMMCYNKCQFYSYDPSTDIGRKEILNVNKALMKRYYMIQRAKDAQVVGITVGTLGVADYLQIIERLKQVIKIAGKKSYLFVMGKLNVAKMANFMEVDVFVLVACPENTLIDSKLLLLHNRIFIAERRDIRMKAKLTLTAEFYKPIVTPFEMELACLRTREWTGDYITDFRDLLPGASASVDIEEEDMDESIDVPDVSLITGHLRPTYRPSKDTGGSSSMSLIERNEETTISTQHHTSAAEYLASRSWRGLEQKLGETPVTKAVEGREGIAAGYTNERGLNQDAQESTSS